MEGSATSEGQNDNFFYRTKVFSKRQHDRLSFSCMHAKNGDAGVTMTTKNKVGVHPSRYRSMASQRVKDIETGVDQNDSGSLCQYRQKKEKEVDERSFDHRTL